MASSRGNINNFLHILKDRLKDSFVQNWHHRLTECSRATLYREIAIFQFQPYLEIVNAKKFQTALSKLRTSSHRLEIEVGRWARPQKILRDNRKCRICNTLEDEFHFIIECPLFQDIRKCFIKPYFIRHKSMLKFVQLLQSKSPKELKNLACFIFKGFEKRTEVLLTRTNN